MTSLMGATMNKARNIIYLALMTALSTPLYAADFYIGSSYSDSESAFAVFQEDSDSDYSDRDNYIYYGNSDDFYRYGNKWDKKYYKKNKHHKHKKKYHYKRDYDRYIDYSHKKPREFWQWMEEKEKRGLYNEARRHKQPRRDRQSD
jgi:hypothetical protein